MLDLKELQLVVFLFMKLSNGFLFEIHFLNIFVLVISFFIEKLLDFIGQRSIFSLKLTDLNFKRFVIFENCELSGWCYSRSRLRSVARVGLGSLANCCFRLFLRGIVLIHNF